MSSRDQDRCRMFLDKHERSQLGGQFHLFTEERAV